jgi:hypothetical protein
MSGKHENLREFMQELDCMIMSARLNLGVKTEPMTNNLVDWLMPETLIGWLATRTMDFSTIAQQMIAMEIAHCDLQYTLASWRAQAAEDRRFSGLFANFEREFVERMEVMKDLCRLLRERRNVLCDELHKIQEGLYNIRRP